MMLAKQVPMRMASSTEVLHDSTVESVIRDYGNPKRYCHVVACRKIRVLLISKFCLLAEL